MVTCRRNAIAAAAPTSSVEARPSARAEQKPRFEQGGDPGGAFWRTQVLASRHARGASCLEGPSVYIFGTTRRQRGSLVDWLGERRTLVATVLEPSRTVQNEVTLRNEPPRCLAPARRADLYRRFRDSLFGLPMVAASRVRALVLVGHWRAAPYIVGSFGLIGQVG